MIGGATVNRENTVFDALKSHKESARAPPPRSRFAAYMHPVAHRPRNPRIVPPEKWTGEMDPEK